MFRAAGSGFLLPGQRGNLVQQQAEGMRRIAAHVIRRAVVSACFQQGAGGAGAAERAQAAGGAFAAQGDLVRFGADLLPGGVKAQAEHGGGRLVHDHAGTHLTLPIDGIGAGAGQAAHFAGAFVREDVLCCPEVFHDELRELRGGQLLLECADAHGGGLLRREAGLLIKRQAALACGGHHVGIHEHGGVQLACEGDHAIDMRRILRGDADAHAHFHAAAAQQANGVDGALKPVGEMAQPGIGFLVRAIEGDIDAPGLVFRKEIRPVLIDERAVGIDGQQHAQLLNSQIQPPEIRIGQRLAARQQQKERARIAHLRGDVKPFAHGAQAALAGDLRRGQADIAHLAVHIADGRELDAAVDGRVALGGALDERALDGGGVFDEMHGISFLGGSCCAGRKWKTLFVKTIESFIEETAAD